LSGRSPDDASEYLGWGGVGVFDSWRFILGASKKRKISGEPVGWVTLAEHSFYPPDVARGGTDLAALVVVRLARADSIARAGEKLLRSGGFGVIVLDLGTADIPMPLQTRLNGLAHHHHTPR
jgi:recombination protein RecA